jgi:hypothetical protein
MLAHGKLSGASMSAPKSFFLLYQGCAAYTFGVRSVRSAKEDNISRATGSDPLC